MRVDETTEAEIRRRREEVARFVIDPANDPAWIGGIREAELLTAPPVAEGTRVRRIATFLGRRIEYVLEVVDLEPSARIVMRSVKSPFPMAVTYLFEDASGATTMRIRVEGQPGRLYRLAAPALGLAVRRSISNDLKRLKRLLESPAVNGGGTP